MQPSVNRKAEAHFYAADTCYELRRISQKPRGKQRWRLAQSKQIIASGGRAQAASYKLSHFIRALLQRVAERRTASCRIDELPRRIWLINVALTGN
jgi:hypothetical protein